MNESVIDPTRETLDLNVFHLVDDEYVIRPEIRDQILDVVRRISDETGISTGNVYIKGSILSHQWLDDTDIDVLVETSPEISDDDYEKVKDFLKEHYDKELYVVGHPLQFYVVRGTYDRSRADGLYDLNANEMVFGPYDIEVDIDDYLQQFDGEVKKIDLTKAELERDVIDYDILHRLKHEDVMGLQEKLEKKIDEINDSIETIVAQYNRLSDLRDHAFEKELSPGEIREYGSKNALPDNVVFKLLERYHYIRFMQKLKRITKKHGEVDSDLDVNRIKKIITQ